MGKFVAAAWRSAETDAQMRAWWDEGLTCAAIAARLRVTKNQVIGAVHRMGLAQRGPGRRPGGEAGPASVSRALRPERARPAPVARKGRATAAPPSLPAHAEPAPDSPGTRSVRRAPESALGIRPARDQVRQGCRGPLWSDSARPDGTFCGQPISPGWQPYCAACRARGTARRAEAA